MIFLRHGFLLNILIKIILCIFGLRLRLYFLTVGNNK